MHLAFDRLFDTGSPGLRRKRLKKDNAYGLPAGDYRIHDLFPVRSDQGPDLYFTVERVKTGEILATARLDTEAKQQTLRLSPQHLQSVEVGEALELLMAVLNEPDTIEELQNRAVRVMELYAHQTEKAAAEQGRLLSQATVENLAQQLDAVMQAHPNEWEPAMDRFLAELKQDFLAGLQMLKLAQELPDAEV